MPVSAQLKDQDLSATTSHFAIVHVHRFAQRLYESMNSLNEIMFASFALFFRFAGVDRSNGPSSADTASLYSSGLE